MKTLKQYMKCSGCKDEVVFCYHAQMDGLDAGLEFNDDHVSLFIIDPKTNKFIVPYYGGK